MLVTGLNWETMITRVWCQSSDPFLWLSGSIHSDRSQHEPGWPSPNSVIRNRPYSQVCCLQGKHSQIFSAGQHPSSVHRPIKSLFQVHNQVKNEGDQHETKVWIELDLESDGQTFFCFFIFLHWTWLQPKPPSWRWIPHSSLFLYLKGFIHAFFTGFRLSDTWKCYIDVGDAC